MPSRLYLQFSSFLLCCRHDVNSEEEEEEELSYSTLARDKRRRPRSRHASHHGGNRSIDLWRHDNAKAFPTLKVCLFVAGFQTVDVDTKLLLLTLSPVIAHFRSQFSKAALNTFSGGPTFLLDKTNNILMGTVKVIYFLS